MAIKNFNAVFVDLWHHVVALKPPFMSKKPHFNFITIHYFWIMGMTIIGSILIYPAGGMAYIDALFFASGGCTQAGLNTIDVNSLNTYQQMILFFLPFLTNPIAINTFVVFLRLYWFEKRFQHIAKEAKRKRGTLSKSRSQMRGERDIGNEEKGVNGRPITVLRRATEAVVGSKEKPDVTRRNNSDPEVGLGSQHDGAQDQERTSSSSDDHDHDPGQYPHPTQIKFASHVMRSDTMADEPIMRPLQWTEQDHIAVLERQRNQTDNQVLRIPGPRDAERGIAPEMVEADEDHRQRIYRQDSHINPARRRRSSAVAPDAANFRNHRTMTDEHAPAPAKRAITIDDTNRPRHDTNLSDESGELTTKVTAFAHIFDIFRIRIPRLFKNRKLHEPHDHSHLHPGAASAANRTRSRRNSFSDLLRPTGSRERNDMVPYLSWQPTIGRNSAFVDLTEEQREELGGIEYRSLKTLALILTIYFWGFTIFGFICLVPWILNVDRWGQVVDAAGVSRVWWGFFTTTTAFNDVGFTLTPDSMISFQTAVWPLLLMSFLIIIGNTGFPVMLRFVIWITSLYIPEGSGFWEEIKFLLDHPRRCFTLLFPSKATWWLFWILVLLNGIDLVFFVVLDLGSTVVAALPDNIKVLDGWFQAVSTRTAGTAVVNIAQLHPAIQVSYLIMMYISVLPIAISVRRTNVYEEQSLGLYGHHGEEGEEDEEEPSYVGAHLRRQLSFDLWYIFLGFFIVTIVEGNRLSSDDQNIQPDFSMFAVLFEIVSAYGTVGLSFGYSTVNTSLSGQFKTLSKLIIIAMQIRGRHRGLPYELDRAILLPSESMHEKEEDATAAARLRARRNSVGTMSGHGVATGVAIDPQTSRETGGEGRDRERQGSMAVRKRKQPSLLSRLMHIGPVVPRESHSLRAERSRSREM